MFFEFSPTHNIYYEEHGSGQPVIFFPGWTMDHSVFKEHADYFSQHYRVILFDPPGCGASSRFERYSFVLYMDVLQALCRYLKVEHPHLIGWSMGGEILLQYCAERSPKARSLSLVCSTPCFVERNDWRYGMPAAAAKRFRKGLDKDLVQTLVFFRQETMQGAAGVDIGPILREAGKHSDPRVARDMMDELILHDQRSLLPRLDTPLLVITGEKDAVCSPEASYFMAEKVHGAVVHSFKAGHVLFLSEIAMFNTVLKDFLQKENV